MIRRLLGRFCFTFVSQGMFPIVPDHELRCGMGAATMDEYGKDERRGLAIGWSHMGNGDLAPGCGDQQPCESQNQGKLLDHPFLRRGWPVRGGGKPRDLVPCCWRPLVQTSDEEEELVPDDSEVTVHENDCDDEILQMLQATWVNDNGAFSNSFEIEKENDAEPDV